MSNNKKKTAQPTEKNVKKVAEEVAETDKDLLEDAMDEDMDSLPVADADESDVAEDEQEAEDEISEEDADEDEEAEVLAAEASKKREVVRKNKAYDIEEDDSFAKKESAKEDKAKAQEATNKKRKKNKNKKKRPAKPVRKYATVSLLVLVVATLVFLLFGLAPTSHNVGAKVYYTTIPYQFDLARLPALTADIHTIQPNAKVDVTYSQLTSYSYLEITVPRNDSIFEYPMITMLNTRYSSMQITSFSVRMVEPSLTLVNILTLAISFAVVLLGVFIAVSIFVDGNSASYIFLMLLHDAVMLFAFYIICRVPEPRMFITALLVTVIASAYFNISKIIALKQDLQSIKKRKPSEAVYAVFQRDAVRSVDTLIVFAIFLVAFVVVGLAFSATSFAYFSVILFIALVLPLYSSTFLLPNQWSARKES